MILANVIYSCIVMATVIAIVNYNHIVITIINYNSKTFKVQATGPLLSPGDRNWQLICPNCLAGKDMQVFSTIHCLGFSH